MSEQLYANGRIAVLSTKLLGADKFARLSECVTVAEGLKVLGECGYGNGLTVGNPNDYEQILMAELDNAIALLQELCFDKNATEYFLCKYDYHNAKVLMKRKYMRQDGVENCFQNVGVSPEVLQQAFVNDDYSACSKNMASACEEIDLAFSEGRRSPQVVDVCLDKAMYRDMEYFAKKSSIPLVKKLFVWEVDTINLMLLYRLKKASQSKDALDEWLISGGSIKKQILENLWDSDSASLDLPDEYRKFYSLCTASNATLEEAELAQKSRRNALLAESSDLLTIQPVVEYFFKKVDEIDKVRYVLISIKKGIDKDRIKISLSNRL